MKKLFRPFGEKEVILIAESGYSIFPPRLYWQPIFYPVLNIEYAIDIASKWNTNAPFGNYLGFVTSFEIPLDYFNNFQIQNVGADYHNELWVLAEELENFNSKIIDGIKVEKVYIGGSFSEYGSSFLRELCNRI